MGWRYMDRDRGNVKSHCAHAHRPGLSQPGQARPGQPSLCPVLVLVAFRLSFLALERVWG